MFTFVHILYMSFTLGIYINEILCIEFESFVVDGVIGACLMD